jgi:hypothetical protein
MVPFTKQYCCCNQIEVDDEDGAHSMQHERERREMWRQFYFKSLEGKGYLGELKHRDEYSADSGK